MEFFPMTFMLEVSTCSWSRYITCTIAVLLDAGHARRRDSLIAEKAQESDCLKTRASTPDGSVRTAS